MSNFFQHSTLFSTASETLHNTLSKLSRDSEINKSEELLKQVRLALTFHEQLMSQIQPTLSHHHSLRLELSRLTRDPGELVSGKVAPATHSQMKNYEFMKIQGKPPRDVCLQAKLDGVQDKLLLIRVLRTTFNLSVEEALLVIDSVKE